MVGLAGEPAMRRIAPAGPTLRNIGAAMSDTPDEWQATLQAAVDEARRSGQRFVGTEHLLLGLLRQNDNVSVRLAGEYGITYEAVHRVYASVFLGPTGDDPSRPGSPPFMVALSVFPIGSPLRPISAEETPQFAPRTRNVVQVAEALAEDSVALAHLLLSLLSDREGVGAGLLRQMIYDQGLPRDTLVQLERALEALIDNPETS
ncbi:MAG: Clp protease N-terminal domain-containing protein [Dehalococcoidia bacterium]